MDALAYIAIQLPEVKQDIARAGYCQENLSMNFSTEVDAKVLWLSPEGKTTEETIGKVSGKLTIKGKGYYILMVKDFDTIRKQSENTAIACI